MPTLFFARARCVLVALTAPAAIALLAGCGGGTSGSTGPPAGHSSPEAAVEGLATSLLADNWAAACEFFAPAEQSQCQSAAASAPKETGTFSIKGQVIQGTEALVSLTGKECDSGGCVSNTDATKGMPPAAGAFADAFTAAASAAVSGALSPIPCIEVDGRWYVTGDASGSGSSAGSPSPLTGSTGDSGGATSPSLAASPSATSASAGADQFCQDYSFLAGVLNLSGTSIDLSNPLTLSQLQASFPALAKDTSGTALATDLGNALAILNPVIDAGGSGSQAQNTELTNLIEKIGPELDTEARSLACQTVGTSGNGG